ncbi:MAG: hypothetical protein EBU46_02940 [Nitrosomonadaceae bacterium]|nr:hypothetical protein [Nitrosomonadaceae bacterium]
MSYIVPRAEIEQQFTQTPVFTEQPLAALIIGPQFKLSRYAIASEKADTLVTHPSDDSLTNDYQAGSNVTYAYTNVPAGAIVDTSYLKVFIENAKVEYFPNSTLGSGASATVDDVSGYPNRVRSSSLVFKTANGHARSAVFASRDVAVGDTVVLTGSSDAGVLTTKVKSLIADVSAAAIGTVTADDDNTGDDEASQITTGGAYTGTKNIVYRLTIERGGAFYSGSNADTCARCKITSNDVDSSATVNLVSNTFFNVGTLGVTAKFTADGTDNVFTAGDIFYIPCTAAANTYVRTLELEDEVPSAIRAATITAQLRYNVAELVLPAIRDLDAGTTNWVATSSGITIKSGATTTHALITNGSDRVELPVKTGSLYVERRDLLTSNATAIGSVTSAASVTEKLGVVHPDNPLAQGAYDAVVNSAGVTVYFGAVPTNDLAGYNAVLELARKDNKYYGVAPMTFDATIQDAVVGHVEAMSTAANAKWRVAWLAKELVSTAVLLDLTADNTNWTATVADDPNTSGTQYTLVTIADANLLDLGIRAGDYLRHNFRLDSNGSTIYDSSKIAAVRSQTVLTLETGLAAAISSAVKVQIHRNYTAAEQANSYAALADAYNNRRVRLVFPSSYKAGSMTKAGFFLAASLAGLRSGVVPHQGLTNIQLLGPTELADVVNTFNEDQLNTIAEKGVWIITQTALGSAAYTRHQLTTDQSGLNFSEDSVTANVDSISYALQKKIAPFIGVYNVSPGNLLALRAAIDGELAFRMTGTFNAKAGNQLLGYTIKKLAANATFKDRVDVEIELQVPGPINVIKLTLTV